MTASDHPVPPVPDPRTLLTELGRRVLEREGIPMFLTLQRPGPAPAGSGEDQRPDPAGAHLAGLLRHYREVLAPDAADDAEPALIEVLQVMGAAHFTPADETARKETSK
ncbi:hypothetical protein [Streptomyces sp. NPDC059398]|uniref:hypothetical protein n=1 Tax=Streptomyces sp. NPDC059398 TaxID=3346820 RepID=UPI0036936914